MHFKGECKRAEEKKGFKFPSAYTILFILIILVAIASWIVPAGQYELNEAGEPIPGSYHTVESNPQRIIADGLMAIVYGIQAEDGTISVYNFGELYGAIDVAFFVLVIGGFLALFLFFAIVIGFVGRLGEDGISETFINGARDMLGVALIIGVARGVSVIMNKTV